MQHRLLPTSDETRSRLRLGHDGYAGAARDVLRREEAQPMRRGDLGSGSGTNQKGHKFMNCVKVRWITGRSQW